MRHTFLLLLLPLLVRCTGIEIEPKATKGPRTELVVNVDGMVCDACAKAVVDQLKRTDGVVASACSYQTKTANITFDAAVTNFDQIQERLSAIGFPIQMQAVPTGSEGATVAPAAGDS